MYFRPSPYYRAPRGVHTHYTQELIFKRNPHFITFAKILVLRKERGAFFGEKSPRASSGSKLRNARNLCISVLSDPRFLIYTAPDHQSPKFRILFAKNVSFFFHEIFALLDHLISELEGSSAVIVDPMTEVQVKPLEQILLVVHELHVLVGVVPLLPAPPPLPTVLAVLRHRPATDAVTLLLPPKAPANPPKHGAHLRRLLLRRDPLTLRLGHPHRRSWSSWGAPFPEASTRAPSRADPLSRGGGGGGGGDPRGPTWRSPLPETSTRAPPGACRAATTLAEAHRGFFSLFFQQRTHFFFPAFTVRHC